LQDDKLWSNVKLVLNEKTERNVIRYKSPGTDQIKALLMQAG